ncbi:hypothetical protein E7V72_30940 [Escherichia coli]|nr:hypothetical protein [Escherichia coli]
MFSESGFTHGDLLRGHTQYVGRSLKVNGPFCRDTYKYNRKVIAKLITIRVICLYCEAGERNHDDVFLCH